MWPLLIWWQETWGLSSSCLVNSVMIYSIYLSAQTHGCECTGVALLHKLQMWRLKMSIKFSVYHWCLFSLNACKISTYFFKSKYSTFHLLHTESHPGLNQSSFCESERNQCSKWSGTHRYTASTLLHFTLWCTATFFLHASTSHKLPVLFSALSISGSHTRVIMALNKLQYPGGITWCSPVPVLACFSLFGAYLSNVTFTWQ